ncbi:hypothetical protein BH24CHL6_BH24CHL6_08760 [soil metagenome]
MTRVRRRTTPQSRTRRDALNVAQLMELTIGPKTAGSFEDEEDARAAWEANRDRLLERYAFHTHCAGWRPDAFWQFEAGVGPEWTEESWRDPEDDPYHDLRLRWLHEHDAFLPGEVGAMRARAKADPHGYADYAWRVVQRLQEKESP